jgi:hypothetical protein
MANVAKQASLERSRSLETAAAELAKSMGRQPDQIRNELVSEVRTLDQSARVKDFIAIIAIRNVKERLYQHHGLSSFHDSSSSTVPAIRMDSPSTQLDASA